MKPERGEVVSVWHRDSRRHKWRMEYGMVRLLMIEPERPGFPVLVQTSETGRVTPGGTGYTGATGFNLRATIPGDKWERELREAVYL